MYATSTSWVCNSMTERSFCVLRFLNRNTFEQIFFFVFVQQTIVNVAAILLLVLDSKKKLNILCITYVLTTNLVRKKVTFFSS